VQTKKPSSSERISSFASEPSFSNDLALEKHYSIAELATLWSLSEKTIRRMFNQEAGVIEWGDGETRIKRAYKTLRIPESVVQRVHRRLRNAS
jgi:hypothetical protein